MGKSQGSFQPIFCPAVGHGAGRAGSAGSHPGAIPGDGAFAQRMPTWARGCSDRRGCPQGTGRAGRTKPGQPVPCPVPDHSQVWENHLPVLPVLWAWPGRWGPQLASRPARKPLRAGTGTPSPSVL